MSLKKSNSNEVNLKKPFIITMHTPSCSCCNEQEEYFHYEQWDNGEQLSETLWRIPIKNLPRLNFQSNVSLNEVFYFHKVNAYYDTKRDVVAFLPYTLIRLAKEKELVEAFMDGVFATEKNIREGVYNTYDEFYTFVNFHLQYKDDHVSIDHQCQIMRNSVPFCRDLIFGSSDTLSIYKNGYDIHKKIDAYKKSDEEIEKFSKFLKENYVIDNCIDNYGVPVSVGQKSDKEFEKFSKFLKENHTCCDVPKKPFGIPTYKCDGKRCE